MSINSESQDEIQGIYVSNSEETSLLSSARRRVQISSEKVKTGSLNVLSAKYEVCDIIFVIKLLNLLNFCRVWIMKHVKTICCWMKKEKKDTNSLLEKT